MYLKQRLLFALLGLGVSLSYFGYSEWQLAKTVEEKPDVVPCAVFESRGPLANHHIKLTGFNATEDMYFAYEEAEYGSGYAKALVPVFPLNRKNEPKNEDLHVILEFSNVASDDELIQLVEQDTVTGITGAAGSSLHGFRGILHNGYPGIDLDSCYVISVDRRLPSQMGGLKFIAAGVTCLFAFAGIVGWGFMSDSGSSWGGGSVADTSSPDYMSRRMSTEMDPAKFQQANASAGHSDLQNAAPQPNEEIQAYQREFEERYGIATSNQEDQPASSL